MITTYASLQKVIDYDLGNDLVFVADEMHNLVTERKLQTISTPKLKYKLGLSATPNRLWKPDESRILIQLFGDDPYEFGIEKALAEKYLVPFNYHPHFVSLSSEEYDKYIDLSEKIAKLSQAEKGGKGATMLDDGGTKYLSSKDLRVFRAKIKKDAENKIPYVVEQIKELEQTGKFDHALIYVDNETMLQGIQHEFTKNQIITTKFVGETPMDERIDIIDRLRSGDIKAILAKRCLDEGVDIPSAKQAFILSNGTDPREYVQRLGRVLRLDKAGGKDHADVHDYLVVPPPGAVYKSDAEAKYARNMIKNEVIRSRFFTNLAINGSEADFEIFQRVSAYGFTYEDDELILKPEEEEGEE